MSYKEAIWHFLIAKGGAIKLSEISYEADRFTSFYGSSINASEELSIQALESIRIHGINYELSNDPVDFQESTFNGTFTSHDYYIKLLGGELVLNNGEKYRWGAKVEIDLDQSFLKMLKLIGEAPSLKQALGQLEERLTQEWGFKYSCVIS